MSKSCLLCFRIKSIQSSPKYCVCFLFSRERFLPFAKGKNQNKLIVFVCWFRLSNLLKIDALLFYFANQNKLLKIANLLSFVKFWWRQTGSNRWPPACKAGALPTELCPRYWWVWEDLNLRPHAYQACALTSWATNPDSLLKRILPSLKLLPHLFSLPISVNA